MNIQIFFSKVKLFGIIFLISFQAFGVDFESAHTLSFGGVGRGGPLLTNSIYLNPAFISLLPVRALSISYAKFSDPSSDKLGLLNGSILDGSQENLFQGGFGYTRFPWANVFHIVASKNIFKTL